MRRALTAALLIAAAVPASAGAAITYVQSASAAGTTATLTINKPSGTTTNDVLVATVSGAGTNAVNAPVGWTQLASTSTASATMRTTTWYKVATAAEGASYAFTSSAARNMTGGIVALRGANSVRPIDAVGTATGASGTAAAPSVVTTAANSWVVTAAAAARNTTFTAASGTTERYDRAGTSNSTTAATATQAAAGATPARTVTPANTTSAWVAHSIAVRDGSAAGLSVSLSGSPAFSADLDSGDAAATWSVSGVLLDTRLTSLGWHLQVTSTQLTAGSRTLPVTATSLTDVGSLVCHAGAPCALPTNIIPSPVAVPAGATAPAPVTFFNAAAATGAGAIDLTINFSVDVPQNAYAGTYSSTVTISVVSGP